MKRGIIPELDHDYPGAERQQGVQVSGVEADLSAPVGDRHEEVERFAAPASVSDGHPKGHRVPGLRIEV